MGLGFGVEVGLLAWDSREIMVIKLGSSYIPIISLLQGGGPPKLYPKPCHSKPSCRGRLRGFDFFVRGRMPHLGKQRLGLRVEGSGFRV